MLQVCSWTRDGATPWQGERVLTPVRCRMHARMDHAVDVVGSIEPNTAFSYFHARKTALPLFKCPHDLCLHHTLCRMFGMHNICSPDR